MKQKLKRIILSSDKDFEAYGIDREIKMSAPFSRSKSNKSGVGSAINIFNENKKEYEKQGLRVIGGYASTTQRDRVKDAITMSAIKGSKDDLLKSGANTVFFNHDTNIPIGRTLKTYVDEVGLFVEVLISKAKDVENYWIKIKEKVLNAFSIRLGIKKMEIIKDQVSGKIKEYRILSMELFENSVVGIPCNPGASIVDTVGKSLNVKKTRQIQKRSKVVKRKKTRAKNITSIVEELIGKKFTSIEEAIKNIANGGKTEEEIKIEESKKFLASKGIKFAEDNVDDDNEEEVDEIEALEKKLKSLKAKKKGQTKKSKKDLEIDRLKSLIKELEDEPAGRQGGDDLDEDEEDNDGSIKKCLKSADDVDTVKYVQHLMDPANEVEFKSLKEFEQEKAKSIFMEMYLAGSIQE